MRTARLFSLILTYLVGISGVFKKENLWQNKSLDKYEYVVDLVSMRGSI